MVKNIIELVNSKSHRLMKIYKIICTITMKQSMKYNQCQHWTKN